MRKALFGLMALVMLSFSTGCQLGDRMFYAHQPWGGGNCGCDDCSCGDQCGGGAECARGQCGDGCANGQCGAGGCANGQCGAGGYGPGGYGGHGGLLHHQPLPRGEGGTYVGPQGPPTAAVAYPYYTLRGPRDFLDPNPPSIGP